jgi:hypothetical protein
MSTPTPAATSAHTLTPQAQAVVTAFGGQSGVTPDHLNNLQSVIVASPALVGQINDAVAQGHLARIVPLTNPNAGGEYNAQNREMRLPLGPLTSPAAGPMQAVQAQANASEVTFVLGHELQHGFNRVATQQGYADFSTSVQQIAQGYPAPRDYTAPTAALMEKNRSDEAGAEIAGWNAIVSRVRGINGVSSLQDIYEANPGRMADFIDVSGLAPASTYTLKPNLAINADMSMTASAANIAAMGQNYFDKPPASSRLGARGHSDYANYYGAYAVSVIAQVDRHYNPPQAGATSPQMGLNLQQLRLSEKLMEENGIDLGANVQPMPYYDTGNAPPTAHLFQDTDSTNTHVSPIGSEVLQAELARMREEAIGRDAPAGIAPGPAESERSLIEKLRDSVRALDRHVGKDWDESSERLSASALVMAKQGGFTDRDELRLAFNLPTQRHAGGEVLHLERMGAGASPDPAANRVHMATSDALAVPAADRLQQADAISQQQAQQQTQQQAQQQAQQANRPDDPVRSGPAMQM